MLVFCCCSAVHAQFGSGLVAPVVIPPSPEAATLAEYADFPSATYTGIPDIKIPIYDLPVSNIDHSIFLSYNSHGFKVQEEASSVGLGWNLISTGVITRSVTGIDDFSSMGFFRHDPSTYSSNPERDTSPDMFAFNINGRTGKFIINYKPANPGGYEIVLLNQSAIKIEILADTTWKVTDEKGVVYNFTQKERTKKEIISTSTDVQNYVSSWYLSNIQSPQGDNIDFVYYTGAPAILKNRYESVSFLDYIFVYNSCDPFPDLPNQKTFRTIVNSFTQQILLEKIIFSNGYLTFGISGRTDLEYQGPTQPKRVSSLVIKTANHKIIKQLNFHQEYFNSGSGRALYYSRRLKLVQIEEIREEGGNKNYSFEYLSGSLPDKDSFAKDYWGFYNGANNNVSPFGNREPSPMNSTANLLTAINFPTGGKTVYTFAANDYGNYNGSLMEENPPLSPNGGRIGPGCRIEKIEFFDENHLSVGIKTYSYSVPNGSATLSSGKRMSGSRFNREGEIDENTPNCIIKYQTISRSSENFFSTGDGGSSYEIGYSLVTENSSNQNSNGKKEYFFVNEPDVQPKYPGAPTFASHRNGSLERTVVYRKNGTGFTKVEEVNDLYKLVSVQSVTSRILLQDYITNIMAPFIYNIPSDWVFIEQSEKSMFHENGVDKFIETTDYKFDNPFHKLRTRESKTLSDGSILTGYYFYPLDYPEGEQSIAQMKSNHLVNFPIEHVQILEKNSQKHIISGSVTKYKPGGQGLKDTEYYLEAVTPIPSATFKFSNRTAGVLPPVGTVSNYAIDPNYKPRIFYDSFQNGKLVQYRLNEGTPESFLWAYNGQFPVAHAKNVAQNHISHTSFELADEKGGWTYSGTTVLSSGSRTGGKYYSLGTGNITKSGTGATAGSPFRLTFWARRSTGSGNWTFMGQTESLSESWKLVEREVAASTVTISGSDIFIDELRLHPVGAQMTTYTHDPLIGITSLTDAKNHTVYYEYYDSGNLKTIRNEDGDIFEHFEYNYLSGH